MSRVLLTSAAEKDYTESLCWYAEQDRNVAVEFEREFESSIQELLVDPERFPVCNDRHRFLLMKRFPFRIIYRIDTEAILIIAVAHAARSPDYWESR